jgi:hypothetical protein
MFARGLMAASGVGLLLAGCGTYVPDIQEFPGDSRAGSQLVTAILTNVKCELRNALDDFYRISRSKKTFLDDWGVQTDLDLTLTEKGEIIPSAELTPNPVFTLGLGVSGSSEATRTDKLMSFNTVAELRALGRCDAGLRGGPMLLQSDLKLNEWLVAALLGADTNSANYTTFTTKDSVLTHEVKFEVITGGNLTPTWKLINATINPSGTFLSASRNRTHDLTITMGPTDVAPKGKRVPSRAAANAALASQIGVAVGNSVRSAIRP